MLFRGLRVELNYLQIDVFIMKRLFVLILFVSFHLVSYNQVVIKGKIFDKKTKEKICFATIYFDGTFVGTSLKMGTSV